MDKELKAYMGKIGARGGKARAKNMGKEGTKALAQHAAKKRWEKHNAEKLAKSGQNLENGNPVVIIVTEKELENNGGTPLP